MTEAEAPLADRSCIPCRGGIPPLTRADAERFLAETPDWALQDDGRRIKRSLTFKTFAGAFAFVGRVASLAEAEGHHPDISFGWGYATLSLQTHAIQGLHMNDFILAAKIDGMVE